MPQATTAERIAANIRARMRENGFNQTDLAAKLGRSQSAMSRRLLGQAPFSLDELDQIADALDVTVADLMAAPAEAAAK